MPGDRNSGYRLPSSFPDCCWQLELRTEHHQIPPERLSLRIKRRSPLHRQGGPIFTAKDNNKRGNYSTIGPMPMHGAPWTLWFPYFNKASAICCHYQQRMFAPVKDVGIRRVGPTGGSALCVRSTTPGELLSPLAIAPHSSHQKWDARFTLRVASGTKDWRG